MIEPCLEFTNVSFRWNINEIQKSLDVVIEALLVGQESLSSAPQPAPPCFIGHQLIEEAGDALFAHLAETFEQTLCLTACHSDQYSQLGQSEKSVLATSPIVAKR